MFSPSDIQIRTVYCFPGGKTNMGAGVVPGYGGLGYGTNGQPGVAGGNGGNGGVGGIGGLGQSGDNGLSGALGQAMRQLSSSVKNGFDKLAHGTGTILRFRLIEPMEPGGAANAHILVREDGGYVRQRNGILHDEEPGGLWEGYTDDEGWCTGRDDQKDHYSVVWMEHNRLTLPTPTTSANSHLNDLLESSGSSGPTYGFWTGGVLGNVGASGTLTWSTFFDDGSGDFAASSNTGIVVPETGLYRINVAITRIEGAGSAGPNPTPSNPETYLFTPASTLSATGLHSAQGSIYFASRSGAVITGLARLTAGAVISVTFGSSLTTFTGLSVSTGQFGIEYLG